MWVTTRPDTTDRVRTRWDGFITEPWRSRPTRLRDLQLKIREHNDISVLRSKLISGGNLNAFYLSGLTKLAVLMSYFGEKKT